MAEEQALRFLEGALRALAAGVVFGEQRGDAFAGGSPFAGQRFDDERADQLHDGAGVGVVGAERGANPGVEAALEQGAEDRGFDGAPVHFAGGMQGVDFAGGELDQLDAGEEAAVEPGDVFEQEIAAGLHGAEEFAERGAELDGVVAALVEDALEEAFGQQADVFGEHAEQTLNEEVGDFLGVVAARGERAGDIGEAAGGVGGDVLHGAAGAEFFGVGE